jgi:hypothetical protein
VASQGRPEGSRSHSISGPPKHGRKVESLAPTTFRREVAIAVDVPGHAWLAADLARPNADPWVVVPQCGLELVREVDRLGRKRTLDGTVERLVRRRETDCAQTPHCGQPSPRRPTAPGVGADARRDSGAGVPLAPSVQVAPCLQAVPRVQGRPAVFLLDARHHKCPEGPPRPSAN